MQILLSLVAILLLVWLAWWLGFRGEPRLDAAAAVAEAEAVLPGFSGREALVASDGRGALVRGADGGLAVVWPLADGWVVRLVPPGAVEMLDGKVRVAVNEPMRRHVEFHRGGAVPLWMA